jgi:hypothetical protein
MSIEIQLSLGWWLAPLALTLLTFGCAMVFGPKMQPQRGSGYPDFGGALAELLKYAAAGNASLLAWLVWALLA